MKSKLILKLVAFGGMTLALFAVLALASAAKPGVVSATANPPSPLLSCPNVDGSPEGKVTAADILLVVAQYGWNYGSTHPYLYLSDLVAPYNQASPSGTGKITAADILAVVGQYGRHCPLVDTQIAKATRAIGDPLFSDVLCDDAGTVKYQNPVLCGGDPQFLTENATFLAGKGYLRGSTDVPGQGIHYVNMSLWDGVFNPARPEGLVYKGGVLVAQLYFAEGDTVGWGPDPTHNVRAVNTDSLPCTTSQEPPGIGCSWNGAFDGWHWHADLCTVGIGTASAIAIPSPSFTSQDVCGTYAHDVLGVTCTFPPTPNFNCTWKAQVGWMGHLWNWLPNANYTNAVNPNANGQCTVAYCATGEANGRFADCFPDTGNYDAYSCPQ